tara:strand:+ start:60 stop:974 length:915 start_codon:yes stop_codon:yes gene_type:complete
MISLNHRNGSFVPYQRGSILVLALVMILVLSLVGISAMSSANNNLKIAENQQRQFEAQLVAENTVMHIVENYPSMAIPAGNSLQNFGMTSVVSTPGQSCVTKAIIAGSGTPGSLACSWTGDGGDHEHFGGTPSCLVGDYMPGVHPHLHAHGGRVNTTLWINGDVIIPKCGDGGFIKPGTGAINYTGTASCSSGSLSNFGGTGGFNVVTQEEFNTTLAGGPLAGKDYYSHVEIRVTTTDPISGATATAVKGLKYRGDGTTSTTVGSPSDATCGIDDANPITEVAEDSDLATNGQKKVLYSYLEID